MFSNEIVAEILRILHGMIKMYDEHEEIDNSDIDRLDLLVEGTNDFKLSDRFRSLLTHFSAQRNHANTDVGSSIKSLASLIETQLFIETANMRAGGDLDVIAFFSPDNKERTVMLGLCGDLRKITNESKSISAPFRNRILKRIAAMELEINKEKGQLDTLIAGLSDVGEAAGKFGDDIKPLVDRATELLGIAKKSSEEYKELPGPEDVKRLPSPDED